MGLVSSKLLFSLKSKRLLLLSLVVLGYHAIPKLRWLFRVLHYKLTAEIPQLVYHKTPQNEKLLQRCVTMTKKKYYPLWYLFNGHLQTVRLAAANDQEQYPAIQYERQILDMPDGGIVSLDWALPRRSDGTIPTVKEVDPERRTVLVLPGLTGGSGELYIRSAVDRLLELGWQVVVMNSRGCADTPLKTAHLFSCAYTDDLRFAIQYFRAKYNFVNEAFIGLGYSMGSNVLVKYLGEEKENAGLTAGISVGNPFDLVTCSANFGGSLFNRLTYDKAMNGNLKTLFFEKSNAHEMFQGYPGLDITAVRNSKSVRDFDHQLTRVTFKYPTVDHYYSDASSIKKLADVKIPLLCVSAKDDPISVVLPKREQVEANPNVILCVTKSGGHLGFFESSFDPKYKEEQRRFHSSSSSSSSSGVQKEKANGGLKMWSVKVVTEYAESVLAHELERKTRQSKL